MSATTVHGRVLHHALLCTSKVCASPHGRRIDVALTTTSHIRFCLVRTRQPPKADVWVQSCRHTQVPMVEPAGRADAMQMRSVPHRVLANEMLPALIRKARGVVVVALTNDTACYD